MTAATMTARPPLVWSQSRSGRAVDLLDPRPEGVDFTEIADTLAHIPRFGGCTAIPLSVAQHTLVACDAAPEWARPWVLLHDAHEARIGDIATPVVRALDALWLEAWREHGVQTSPAPGRPLPCPPAPAVAPSALLAAIKARHDDAIHAAAGLPVPWRHADGPRLADVIDRADRIALVTERRDFMAPAAHPWSWGGGLDGVPPLAARQRYMPPAEAADRLMARFRQYLPALDGGA